MAGYENQTLTLDLPGDLPVHLTAHYDVDVTIDRFSREPSYTIKLGLVEWTLGGHPMWDIEGKEIPPAMREKILAAITVSESEMKEALSDEAEEVRFRREHAAGAL